MQMTWGQNKFIKIITLFIHPYRNHNRKYLMYFDNAVITFNFSVEYEWMNMGQPICTN